MRWWVRLVRMRRVVRVMVVLLVLVVTFGLGDDVHRRQSFGAGQ